MTNVHAALKAIQAPTEEEWAREEVRVLHTQAARRAGFTLQEIDAARQAR